MSTVANGRRAAAENQSPLRSARRRRFTSIEQTWRPEDGSPVFTVEGIYRSRGWTEWTQGFQFGAPLLQFDATGDREFLELGRSHTLERMAPHLTHVGVHDHGFNNVSTYGNLWRLAREGKFDAEAWEVRFYALALKVTGAVQATRWTPLPDGGFIHSFNGAHSLFVDTIRTLRALALSHVLGHRLLEEQDAPVNLLQRLLDHARATADYSVYYGKGRDMYDMRGRTAHESLFNPLNGTYRGPCSQQGYSPFSTWTSGLALGNARIRRTTRIPRFRSRITKTEKFTLFTMRRVRRATFISTTLQRPTECPIGIPAPPVLLASAIGAHAPADPFNDHEPVDSSAAAIAAQGLLRLARVAAARGTMDSGTNNAGLRVLETLIDEFRAVPQHRCETSGTAPALDLSPSKRVGSCAFRIEDSPRRIEHVGRLPSARSGAVRETPRRRRPVSDIFRSS